MTTQPPTMMSVTNHYHLLREELEVVRRDLLSKTPPGAQHAIEYVFDKHTLKIKSILQVHVADERMRQVLDL